MTRILVICGEGQVGFALRRPTWPDNVDVVALRPLKPWPGGLGRLTDDVLETAS